MGSVTRVYRRRWRVVLRLPIIAPECVLVVRGPPCPSLSLQAFALRRVRNHGHRVAMALHHKGVRHPCRRPENGRPLHSRASPTPFFPPRHSCQQVRQETVSCAVMVAIIVARCESIGTVGEALVFSFCR
jgi:hypothetical protein